MKGRLLRASAQHTDRNKVNREEYACIVLFVGSGAELKFVLVGYPVSGYELTERFQHQIWRVCSGNTAEQCISIGVPF